MSNKQKKGSLSFVLYLSIYFKPPPKSYVQYMLTVESLKKKILKKRIICDFTTQKLTIANILLYTFLFRKKNTHYIIEN